MRTSGWITCVYITVLIFVCWLFLSTYLLHEINGGQLSGQLPPRDEAINPSYGELSTAEGHFIANRRENLVSIPLADVGERKTTADPTQAEQLLSRQRGVEVQCDVRGNLGPCGVIIQNPPGTDWYIILWI